MDPATAAIAVGGIGALGSILGGNQANAANEQIATQNRDFQEYMSDTAHQREVQDLRAAGLNPILSGTGGGGASTPAGSTATMQNSAAGLPGAISAGMDTAVAIRGQNKDFQAKDAQISNLTADTANKSATADLIRNQTNATAMDIRQKDMSNQIMSKTLDAQIKKANAEGDYAQINQLMGVINSGASTVKDLVNPFTLLKGKK